MAGQYERMPLLAAARQAIDWANAAKSLTPPGLSYVGRVMPGRMHSRPPGTGNSAACWYPAGSCSLELRLRRAHLERQHDFEDAAE